METSTDTINPSELDNDTPPCPEHVGMVFCSLPYMHQEDWHLWHNEAGNFEWRHPKEPGRG